MKKAENQYQKKRKRGKGQNNKKQSRPTCEPQKVASLKPTYRDREEEQKLE